MQNAAENGAELTEGSPSPPVVPIFEEGDLPARTHIPAADAPPEQPDRSRSTPTLTQAGLAQEPPREQPGGPEVAPVHVDDPGDKKHWTSSSPLANNTVAPAGPDLEKNEVPEKVQAVPPTKPSRRDDFFTFLANPFAYPLVWERVVYAIVTCCYYLYRSRGSPTFTHDPFKLKLNDLWGLLFMAMFLATRRGSYLVYAINPFRNMVLVGLQQWIPSLEEREVSAEFHRDVISASLQLSCAFLISVLVKPQPIGVDTEFEKPIPYASRHLHRILDYFCTAAFLLSSLVMVFLGLNHHTTGYSNFLSDHHGWKVIFAVLLGTAEEVTWREAYLKDNNNFLQAFTWGMNHLVVGEGMDNPFVYGLVSFGYAFVLGVSQYRLARYANHSCIEYLIMDNLIKPVVA